MESTFVCCPLCGGKTRVNLSYDPESPLLTVVLTADAKVVTSWN